MVLQGMLDDETGIGESIIQVWWLLRVLGYQQSNARITLEEETCGTKMDSKG